MFLACTIELVEQLPHVGQLQEEMPSVSSSSSASSKRQLVWDWKRGRATEKHSIPEKKKKTDDQNKQPKNTVKYFCLECLEISLQGKMDERCVTLSRVNTSSVNRHKMRWHNTPQTQQCTIVPSTAPEVQQLNARYGKAQKMQASATKSSGRLQPVSEPTLVLSLDEPRQPELEFTLGAKIVSQKECESISVRRGTSELTEPAQTITPQASLKESPAMLGARPTQQKTLLSFRNAPQTNTETINQGKDTTLEDVMKAISSLSVKVESFGKQHATLEQLVSEDSDVLRSLTAMRQAINIHQLAEASKFLEFYYDEDSETALLRCLPCFKLQLAARPTLNSLTPLAAQRIINPSSNGTIGTGIIFKKDTTRLLIEGHNQTWYRQKKSCIDHLCLVGDGGNMHKRAMEAFQREEELARKRSTAATNIFRAAVVDLKQQLDILRH